VLGRDPELMVCLILPLVASVNIAKIPGAS
jgi:hypothetical protein